MSEEADFDVVAEGPAPSDQPVGTTPSDGPAVAAHPSVRALRSAFPDAIVHSEVQSGDQHVVYVDPSRNTEVLAWLKDDPGQRYDLLVDVTAVDYGGGRPIQVVYQLWSIPERRALRVKCELPLTHLEIASVTELWHTANWLEREVYDMFGVEFTDHPDLRRILMPENYAEGHPLRKDFPLRGRFSRAEQTRRALAQDLEQYYVPDLMEGHGPPQVVTPAEADDSPAEATE